MNDASSSIQTANPARTAKGTTGIHSDSAVGHAAFDREDAAIDDGGHVMLRRLKNSKPAGAIFLNDASTATEAAIIDLSNGHEVARAVKGQRMEADVYIPDQMQEGVRAGNCEGLVLAQGNGQVESGGAGGVSNGD